MSSRDRKEIKNGQSQSCDLKHHEINENRRRYSRTRARGKIACRECRRRRVRCDLEQQVYRCTNCKLDHIECVSDVRARGTQLVKTSTVPSLAPQRLTVNDMYQSASYARVLPSHLKAEEVHYLEAIRVFDVPKDPIVKELLTAYINHVHSFFPVLDLRAFLETTLLHRTKDSRQRVSLQLLHAVLAAGLVFVDQQVLKQAGWSTKDGFRNDLLRRTRALYHMNYDHDQLVLCQISLLASIAEEDPKRPEECRRWLGLAWMHLESSSTVMDSPEEPKDYEVVSQSAFWRRLWWACYVQGHRLTLATRRPILRPLGSGMTEISQLSTEDFEIRCHSTVVTEAFPSLPILHSTQLQEEMIKLCIANNELYAHLDGILRCEKVSFDQGPWAWGLHQGPRGLWQCQPPFPTLTYDECHRRLSGWVNTYACYVLHKHSFDDIDSVKLARFIELRIVLTSGLNLLISSRLSDTESNTSTNEAQKMSFKLLQAATEVIIAFGTLGNHGLLHCISPAILQLLMPAAAVHFKHCYSQGENGRKASLWRLKQCLRDFNLIKCTYTWAESNSAFLKNSISQLVAIGGPLSQPTIGESAPSLGTETPSNRGQNENVATSTPPGIASTGASQSKDETHDVQSNVPSEGPASITERDEGSFDVGMSWTPSLITAGDDFSSPNEGASTSYSYCSPRDPEAPGSIGSPNHLSPPSIDYDPLISRYANEGSPGAIVMPNTIGDIEDNLNFKCVAPSQLVL